LVALALGISYPTAMPSSVAVFTAPPRVGCVTSVVTCGVARDALPLLATPTLGSRAEKDSVSVDVASVRTMTGSVDGAIWTPVGEKVNGVARPGGRMAVRVRRPGGPGAGRSSTSGAATTGGGAAPAGGSAAAPPGGGAAAPPGGGMPRAGGTGVAIAGLADDAAPAGGGVGRTTARPPSPSSSLP
jgi:hypothetical protein